MEKSNSGSIKALDKAILVLDFIRESPCPVGVNEIARQCSLNITTTFRILQTLKESKWIYQDKNEKYQLGPKLSYISRTNNFHTVLQEVSYYTMQRMSAQTSHAMNLAVRDYNQCFILQQSRTNKIVDYVPPIGTALPLYASAVGKVLMAWLPERLLNMILNSLVLTPLTRYTITSPASLMEELTLCRQNHYALDVMESQEGGCCIAVPIRCNQEVVAALSFSGIIKKLQPDEIIRYSNLLASAASEIEQNLFQLNGSALYERRCPDILESGDELP